MHPPGYLKADTLQDELGEGCPLTPPCVASLQPSASDSRLLRYHRTAVAAVLGAFGLLALAATAGRSHWRTLAEGPGPASSDDPRTEVSQLFAGVTDVLQSVKLVQSAASHGNWKKMDDPKLVSDFDVEGPTVQVNTQELDQSIFGFGGGFTEATALVFQNLSSELQDQFIKDYFSEEGLGYTMGRVPINSCDFSKESFSYDDTPDDMQLKHFDKSASRDSRAVIPLIKRAQSAVEARGHALRLLATPFSPPAWMKRNRKMTRSFSPCLREGYESVWAEYIAKWISAYKAQGVNIWGVTVQNSPSLNLSYESCVFERPAELSFLGDHLGPTLKKQHPDVYIFGHDDSKKDVFRFAAQAKQHDSASTYFQGVAFHWYGGDHFDNLQSVHKLYPDLILLPSEASYEKWRFKDPSSGTAYDWSFGLGYAHDIIGDLNAGSSGWLDWNLALDADGGPNHAHRGCDAAMIKDEKGKLWKHAQYYVLGHFTRFIKPRSRRARTTVTNTTKFSGAASAANGGISTDDPRRFLHPPHKVNRPYGTCTGADGLEATSFVAADGKVTVVVLNCGQSDVDFKIRFNNGTAAIKAKIPARGIQTYIVAGLFVPLKSSRRRVDLAKTRAKKGQVVPADEEQAKTEKPTSEPMSDLPSEWTSEKQHQMQQALFGS